MNKKNGFGKTQHHTPAPYFWDFNEFESVFFSLESNLKTGLDKITKEKYKSIIRDEYEIIKRKIGGKSYKFSRFKKVESKKGRIVYIPTIRDRLTIEYLKDKFEEVYEPIYPNREDISDLLISKLSFRQELYIFRYDIKSFFSSIPHQILAKKIKESNYLTTHSYKLFISLLRSNLTIGLPTGLSINNILVEIFLKDIDFQIKKVTPRMSLYCRYVDDIVIMINGNLKEIERDRIDNVITNIFKKNGLKLNTDAAKKQIIHVNANKAQQFNFLGYEYSIDNGKLKIGINGNKEGGIIESINFMFDCYCQNKNMDLLLERLSYLTSVNTMVKLRRTKRGKYRPFLIRYGLLESYKNIDLSIWENYDRIIAFRLHNDLKIELANRKLRRRLFKNQFYRNRIMNKRNAFHKYTNSDFINKILKIEPNLVHNDLSKLNRNKLEIVYKEILCL